MSMLLNKYNLKYLSIRKHSYFFDVSGSEKSQLVKYVKEQ